MKYYKIKRRAKEELEEIKFDDYYISSDLNYISGTTSPLYNFNEEEDVCVSTPYTQGLPVRATIKTKKVMKQGYCVYDFPYLVYQDNDIEYIIYNNGKPYYKQNNGKFLVQGNEYTKTNNVVKIPTTYYVYDNEITIGNVIYEIDTEERSDTFNYILTLENNDIVTINFYTKEDKELNRIVLDSQPTLLFTINKKEDKLIDIDTVTCCEDVGYIIYGDNKYYIIGSEKESYVEIDGNTYKVSSNSENYNSINVNGDEVPIDYETVSTQNGNILILYLKYQESLNTEIPIICKATQPINSQYFVYDGGYIIYNGEKYNVKKEIVHKIKTNDNDYYRLYYNDDNTYAYITINGVDIFYKIKDANTVIKDTFTDEGYVEKEYKIEKFDGVIINGEIYEVTNNERIYSNVENDNSVKFDYVSIYEKPLYFLKIIEIKNNNLVKCCVDFDNCNLTDNEYEAEIANISNTIASNNGLFSFIYPNVPFGYKFILDKELKDDTEIYDDVPTDIEKNLHIYKIHDYVTIQMPLSNDSSININQGQVVQDYFVKKEIDKSVTTIVDMEKDLYYPCYKEKEEQFQNLQLINEIIFNLHFRTRNLETWKIIEDESEPNSGETTISNNCNWFITDYYKGNLSFSNLKDKLNASDLLGFLDFTNDDVFYQKSKLSKSFLRLTFYDSPDPKRQSLLHSATVFVNEGLLYNKFINNVKNGEFITIIENDDSLSKSDINGISTSVSVDNEVAKNGNIILDDNKRLSSQFILKNRYEEETSSEGFYVYMFKNLTNKLHEKSIYMKVEFNHAGVGRTIPFILPMNEDGTKPLTFDNEADWETLKKGVKLKDLYKNMFIELKVVYDAVNNRYSYYRPQVNEKGDNKMIFNLFELKIANEN